jgi:hypothetical protein
MAFRGEARIFGCGEYVSRVSVTTLEMPAPALSCKVNAKPQATLGVGAGGTYTSGKDPGINPGIIFKLQMQNAEV